MEIVYISFILIAILTIISVLGDYFISKRIEKLSDDLEERIESVKVFTRIEIQRLKNPETVPAPAQVEIQKYETMLHAKEREKYEKIPEDIRKSMEEAEETFEKEVL